MQATSFSPPHSLNTAVLFLVFNRLENTKKVFEAIKKARPPRLYIAADGAREAKEGESETVEQIREYITSSIDWECEVKTLFRESNLGCKIAVSGAIDWFFENEEMGIILEDDCLPSQSFFWFCEELLERYKDDMRIWHISGTNLQSGIQRGSGDYYISKYYHVWGWASWKSRWKFYDVELKTAKNSRFLKKTLKNIQPLRYWSKAFSTIKKKRIDTWDYQWIFICWMHNGCNVVPNKNLVKNIGHGPDATHTTNIHSEMANLDNFDVQLPLRNIDVVELNNEADVYIEKKFFIMPNLLIRVINKLVRDVKYYFEQ